MRMYRVFLKIGSHFFFFFDQTQFLKVRNKKFKSQVVIYTNTSLDLIELFLLLKKN